MNAALAAPLADAGPIQAHLLDCLDRAAAPATPFPHLLLTDVLPRATADSVTALPLDPPRIGDTQGRRETHNASRIFFAPDQVARFPACGLLSQALQDGRTVAALQRATGARLDGAFLRIEYCLDTGGFWLEPHTDIGAKLFTMLVYLSDTPGSADWGTDVYDAALTWRGRAPAAFNSGLAFVPASDTWHGFEARDIVGVRRSLIVNYVAPEWRSRHELAFPHHPVRAGS